MQTLVCPCQSGLAFDQCCAPFISGQAVAPSPEALMRSRFTAFARNEIDYLGRTMVEEHRHAFHPEEIRSWNKDTDWLGLEILETATQDETGMVRFRAEFRRKGVTQNLVEHSRFVRRDGVWFYLDGEHETTPSVRLEKKTGRNDPCPCGSGKKFKKCCG